MSFRTNPAPAPAPATAAPRRIDNLNFGSATLLSYMSANGDSNTHKRPIGELQDLPIDYLNILSMFFHNNTNLIGPYGIYSPPNSPSASDTPNTNVAAKRAAIAGPAATAYPTTPDPKADALGKISKALKLFAENCLKNKFVMVLADQSETARIIITDTGKTLVQVEEDKVSSWMVLPGASAQDSDETDADAEEWAKNFAGHVSSMITQAETDITNDPNASAPSNRPVKKLLRIYGNDKVFHVTISTGSKSPSTIKYSYVELQLPEDFAHFHIILARQLN